MEKIFRRGGAFADREKIATDQHFLSLVAVFAWLLSILSLNILVVVVTIVVFKWVLKKLGLSMQ